MIFFTGYTKKGVIMYVMLKNFSSRRVKPLHYSSWHITSDCSAIVIKVKCFPKHDERWLWMTLGRVKIVYFSLESRRGRRKVDHRAIFRLLQLLVRSLVLSSRCVGHFKLTDSSKLSSGWDPNLIKNQQDAGC